VTAFDLSPTAIDWCRRRFPKSSVRYLSADLFNLPTDWHRTFDFVLEINTLQTLPSDLRPLGIACVADLVKPGGTLLVICRGREANEPAVGPPWPLVVTELDAFDRAGLTRVSLDDRVDQHDPPVRRFVVEFSRPV
jgi:SAM-dependent methyltransferase